MIDKTPIYQGILQSDLDFAGFAALNASFSGGGGEAGDHGTVAYAITYVSPTSAALSAPSSNSLHLLSAVGGSEPLAGLVDEWGMWKGRIPTAVEITALYNGGAGLPLSSFTT